MAWPPAVLPINRSNATPQLDTHAADHNALAQAMNDTTTKITTVATDVANLKNADVAAPAGLIGIAERTTAVGPVAGAATGIGGLVVNVTLTRQRMLRVEFQARQLSTAAPDAGSIQLRADSTVIIDGVYVTSTSGFAPAIHIVKYAIFAAGAHQFEAWAAPGAQAVTISAVSYSPIVLAVSDYGDR